MPMSSNNSFEARFPPLSVRNQQQTPPKQWGIINQPEEPVQKRVFSLVVFQCQSFVRLHTQQAIKERAIAFERLAKIFSVHILATIPLLLQLLSLRSKLLCDALHDVCDKTIRVLYGRAGFVDKGRLNLIPSRTKIVQFVFREKWVGLRLIFPIGLSIGRIGAQVIAHIGARAYSVFRRSTVVKLGPRRADDIGGGQFFVSKKL